MMQPSPLAEAITRDLLIAEAYTWARRIGVADRLQEVHVRPMRRKWASISTRGRLTLSSDLLRQPAAFRREVLVHELVHLKLGHGLHNALFYALVRAYCSSEGQDTKEKHPTLALNRNH
ncbi:M48 metallopeptidase family protein [Thermogemmata fonticola]|jgi:predicted metal-dependent hydrolase|uniref:M48 family metallopeptidase n=1 Tax=Thermogemmata fonticola TaxID=2755323 RepID=A0A7V8VAY5_9BACT|nr:M48 family metallopeptidase [Thermogemmata fonticola]MBA2224700.1 M48 family metallopeptidase [Thermogemmata fonticola]